MAGSLNKVCLLGNVGNDPESHTTKDGRQVASFSLATSENWKDKSTGEKREKTEWHKVVVFSEGLAKVASQYLKKGGKVYLEGQLQTRKWQDKEGHDRYTTEIVLQGFNAQMILLDSRNSEGAAQNGGFQKRTQDADFPEDDLPF